jgi:hypothetical protein
MLPNGIELHTDRPVKIDIDSHILGKLRADD